MMNDEILASIRAEIRARRNKRRWIEFTDHLESAVSVWLQGQDKELTVINGVLREYGMPEVDPADLSFSWLHPVPDTRWALDDILKNLEEKFDDEN